MGSLWSKTVDEKYPKCRITDFDVGVVKGYPPTMPHIPLTDVELDALVK
jgi:hypothetical protein